jgi:hypothetical protein
MPQYDNPFSMMPNPYDFKGPGGQPNAMSGMVTGQRQQMAAPFISMLQQQMQQQTDTGEQTLKEFMSPSGQATRESERRKIRDEGDIYNQTKEDTIFASHEKKRLQPFLTDQQIAEAESKQAVARHELYSEPIAYMSGVASRLRDLPKEQRAAAYQKHLEGSGYDRTKLPTNLQQWTEPSDNDPGTMSHLAQARWSQIYTPKYGQEIGKIQEQAKGPTAVANIQAASSLANINRQIQGGVYGDTGRQQGVLEAALRTGIDPLTGKKLDSDAKTATQDSLRRIKSKNVMDYVTKNMEFHRMQNMIDISAANGDPKKLAAANEKLQDAWSQHFNNGLQIEGLSRDEFNNVQKSGSGKQVTVGGVKYDVTGTNKDGSMKIRDPKTGRTGSYTPDNK